MSFGPFFVGEVPDYVFTIKDKDTGTVVDLTSYSAPKVMLKKKGETANRHIGDDENGSIDDPATAGKISYTLPSAWASADIGSWAVQLQMIVGTQTRKTEKVGFSVEDALSPRAE